MGFFFQWTVYMINWEYILKSEEKNPSPVRDENEAMINNI